MSRLVLLLAIAAVIYILWRRVGALPPHKRRAEYTKIVIGAAFIIALGLAATGRMHWVGAAITGLLVFARQALPLLIRAFPLLSGLRSKASAGGQNTSTVESEMLRMLLDHDSGDLSGEVIKGQFAGWRLQDMDKDQLRRLLEECEQYDAESVQLLDSYLQQRFPNENFGASRSQQQSAGSGQMSRAEALAVLGLEEGAGDEDIVSAHRKLMQKLHPDRGGNDYLAARVNQAKDILLGA